MSIDITPQPNHERDTASSDHELSWQLGALVSAGCVSLIFVLPNGGADLVIRQARAWASHNPASAADLDIGPTSSFSCHGNLMTRGIVSVNADSPIQSSNQLHADRSNTLAVTDYGVEYDTAQTPACRTIDDGHAWYVLDANQLAASGDIKYAFADGDGWAWVRATDISSK